MDFPATADSDSPVTADSRLRILGRRRPGIKPESFVAVLELEVLFVLVLLSVPIFPEPAWSNYSELEAL